MTLQEIIHLYQNGKDSVLTNITPDGELNYLHSVVSTTVLPNRMQNKDGFRNSNTQETADLCIKTIQAQDPTKFVLFKDYTEETPQNKIIMLGAMFHSLYHFFDSNKPQPYMVTYDEDQGLLTEIYKKYNLHNINYDSIPKRYHSAIRKPEFSEGYLISYYQEREQKTPLFFQEKQKISLLFKNAEAKQRFYVLMVEAHNLINSIFHIEKKVTFYANQGQEATSLCTATPSQEFKILQKFVLDEELNTVKRLHEIFTEIAKLVYFVQRKTNAVDIMAEFEKTTKRTNEILNAQPLVKQIRNSIEMLTNKYAKSGPVHITETIKYLEQQQKQIISQLKTGRQYY